LNSKSSSTNAKLPTSKKQNPWQETQKKAKEKLKFVELFLHTKLILQRFNWSFLFLTVFGNLSQNAEKRSSNFVEKRTPKFVELFCTQFLFK
jgi:hypothetical protein